MTGTTCLELRGLSKRFGALPAIDDLSLVATPGERLAIIGPKGAGKSTLFKLLCGELPVSSGRILMFGSDVTGFSARRRATLGAAWCSPSTRLFAKLTVLENLLVAAQSTVRGAPAPEQPIPAHRQLYERTQRFLAEAGLLDKCDTVARDLAPGKQRLVAVCLALIGRPRLLLLDEPTAGLSPDEATAVVETLRSLDASTTVVSFEQDLESALALADVVAVLDAGRVIARGTAQEIRTCDDVQAVFANA